MGHKLKQILLIDDKDNHQNDCGAVFVEGLSVELKPLVDFRANLTDIVSITDEFEVDIRFESDYYEIVMIHGSYDSPLLNLSQMGDFKDKVSRCITFSGGADVNFEKKSITRKQLYGKFPDALQAYMDTQVFPVKYLFSQTVNRFYPLLDKMQRTLEESDVKTVIESVEFEKYVQILGFKDVSAVKRNFSENYSEVQINEWIGDQRVKFNL